MRGDKNNKEVTKTAQDHGQKTQQQAYVTKNLRYSEKATKSSNFFTLLSSVKL